MGTDDLQRMLHEASNSADSPADRLDQVGKQAQLLRHHQRSLRLVGAGVVTVAAVGIGVAFIPFGEAPPKAKLAQLTTEPGRDVAVSTGTSASAAPDPTPSIVASPDSTTPPLVGARAEPNCSRTSRVAPRAGAASPEEAVRDYGAKGSLSPARALAPDEVTIEESDASHVVAVYSVGRDAAGSWSVGGVRTQCT